MDIKLKLTYNASIMLDAFKDLLCSQLCWHNRPGPISDPLCSTGIIGESLIEGKICIMK